MSVNLVVFEAASGGHVAINPTSVAFVSPGDNDLSHIHLQSGGTNIVTVRSAFQEVVNALRKGNTV